MNPSSNFTAEEAVVLQHLRRYDSSHGELSSYRSLGEIYKKMNDPILYFYTYREFNLKHKLNVYVPFIYKGIEIEYSRERI